MRVLPGPLPEGTPADWLADVLVTLLQRGGQIMAVAEERAQEQLWQQQSGGGGGGEGGEAALLRWRADVAAWEEGTELLAAAFQAHVTALTSLKIEMLRACSEVGAPPVAPEALAAVRALASRPLAQHLMGGPLAGEAAEQLKLQLKQLLQ